MNCSNCNKEIKEEDNFCIYCGTPINDMKNRAKNKTSKKIKLIIPVLMIFLIIISIVLIIIAKANTNKRTEDTNTINEETTNQNNTTNEIANNTSEEITSENLLDEIYAKYPKLKDTEGIICTDGESYWLLDENGEKVYFDSMESFEQAKEKCNINVEAVEKNKDIEINEETTTTTAPQESLSETGSTGSQNNNYNSQDTNKNTGPVTIAFNVRFENITGDKDIYCVLHENKKVQDPGEEGVQVYFDNKLVATVKQDDINYYGAKAFEYTFNNQDKVKVKLVAPFAYGAVNTSNEDMPYQKDVVIAEYDLNIKDIQNNYYYLY